MSRTIGAEKGAAPPSRPSAAGSGSRTPEKGAAPVATNSWARRTILSRAHQIGLPQELAKQVGSVALWYYNRIVLMHQGKAARDQELPHDTNRYLVPITLALACDFKAHHVELERLLRLSGTPTRKTIDTAQAFLVRYAQWLTPARTGGGSPRSARGPGVRSTPSGPRPAARAEFQMKSPAAARSSPTSEARAGAARPAPSGTRLAPVTALAVPVSGEILRLRSLFHRLNPPNHGPRAPPRPRHQNTNAWARKRIVDVSRTLGLPEHVRKRSLEVYERIVDLHSEKGHAPAGKRLQLSPRLNWSLVYTTLYLGCRLEEYPKDLRDILGANPHQGSLREMYGLYRFYKRELKLTIKLVDVKTFILSWLDGFELSDLMQERAAASENEWVKNRAIAIANKARGHTSLRKTSTKMIAAGAFTTALVEREPPGNLRAFYRAVADFLHMSEDTIRFIVTRIGEII